MENFYWNQIVDNLSKVQNHEREVIDTGNNSNECDGLFEVIFGFNNLSQDDKALLGTQDNINKPFQDKNSR